MPYTINWPNVKWSAASFQYIMIALNLAYYKNKLYKPLDYWWRDMLDFDFLGKGLGIVAPQNFAHIFSGKMFLVLYFINWANFIVWFPVLLEILGNKCIEIVSFPGCDVISFNINLIFLIKPFFYVTKK